MGRRLKALVAVSLAGLMGCRAEALQNRTASNGAGADVNGATPAAAPRPAELARYKVAGHVMGILVRDGDCFLADLPATGGPEVVFALGLRAPCYVLTWEHPPPKDHPDGAVPIGGPGDAMAWHFGGAAGSTVLIAIGDPVSEAQWEKRPKLRGARCAARYRGVRLRGAAAELSARTADGFVCVESGRDEKDFWMFGHEQ